MRDGELISVVIPAYNRARHDRAGDRGGARPELSEHRDRRRRRRQPATTPPRKSRRSATRRSAWCATRRTAAPRRRATPGSQHARGAWIAFQDSDDDWLVEKLARQAAHMASLPAGYVATFCTKIDYGCDQDRRYGRRLASVMPDPRETIESGDLHRRLMLGNIIGPQTVLIAKAAFAAAGGFDERLRNNEDWDFFIRLCRAGTDRLPRRSAGRRADLRGRHLAAATVQRRELRAGLRQDPPQADRRPRSSSPPSPRRPRASCATSAAAARRGATCAARWRCGRSSRSSMRNTSTPTSPDRACARARREGHKAEAFWRRLWVCPAFRAMRGAGVRRAYRFRPRSPGWMRSKGFEMSEICPPRRGRSSASATATRPSRA